MTGKAQEHAAWFRAKVLEALNDTRPDIPDEEIEAYFAGRREAALRKAETMGRAPVVSSRLLRWLAPLKR
jgi:DNA-damage-inducible protein J